MRECREEPGPREAASEGRGIALAGCRVWGHPGSDAVVLRGGRIDWIGRRAENDLAVERMFEVSGGLLLPGFVDAHVHLLHTGLAEIGWHVDLTGRGRAETLTAVRDAARARGAGEWVVATGWDESRWEDQRSISRRDLDDVAPRNPVLAVRVDGHVLVANSVGLAREPAASILAQGPLDVDGGSGEVREATAGALVTAVRPDRSTLEDGLRAAARLCHRVGVVSAHTMCDGVDPDLFFAAAERLALRMVVNPPVEALPALIRAGRRTGEGSAWARWGGVKVFLDGSIGARTAAVSEPFRSGGAGCLLHSDAELAALLRAANEAGWRSLAHAIGDRAIEQLLRAHEALSGAGGLRHRVEHFELPSEGQIERAAKIGLCACMQPNFAGNWSGRGSLYERELGSRRDARSDPHRAVRDAGIRLGFGSDGMPISPLYGIASAVSPPHGGQRLSVEEAIDAYTVGGAYLAGDEAEGGALDVGKRADIVVLDEARDGELGEVGRRTVRATFVDGACVYERAVT